MNVEKTPGDLSETATESDVFGESHNPPFLNEEWLAFLNRTAREILNKEMDTLRDSNMVSFHRRCAGRLKFERTGLAIFAASCQQCLSYSLSSTGCK